MPHILIYTKQLCSYCLRAKQFLKEKGVAFDEIAVDGDARRYAEMVSLAKGARTVPQIFIDGRLIGGCDELLACEKAGQLDALLSQS